MAWYTGTAYDPSNNAAQYGGSQTVNGIQVIPGAPGWDPNNPATANAMQLVQQGLASYNQAAANGGGQQYGGTSIQFQPQQQPQQPQQPAQPSTPQWATDLQTQISQLMQGVGGLGGLGNWNAGMWGNQTSPVYKPNQPAPTNGWGNGWGAASPFRPTF